MGLINNETQYQLLCAQVKLQKIAVQRAIKESWRSFADCGLDATICKLNG